MARQKKPPKNQRTLDDLVIEDAELAEALATVTELEPSAKAFREARQAVKKLIQTEHVDVINAITVDGRERWTVVDGHRFLYKTAERPAAKKAAPAGVTTVLEIKRIVDLDGPAEPPTLERVRMNVDGVEAAVDREPLSPEAERLLRDLPDGPSINDITEEQQEARDALATRSRNR